MVTQLILGVLNRETVAPDKIDSDGHLFGLCGSIEAALTGSIILKLCQGKGAWLWLTETEIIKCCRQKSEHYPVKLQELIEAGMLRKNEGSLYQVTHEFVRRCYLSRPANGATTEAPHSGVAPA